MGSETDLDVLIVGGGPAGLAVASRLRGLRGLLVHQDREIGTPVRTSGGSWHSEMLRLGIPEHLFHKLERAEIFSDRKRFDLSLEHDPVVILDVTALYLWLAEQARVEVRCVTKCTDVRRDGTGYIADLRHPDQGRYTVRARKIVDATGWHCAVLASLGLAEPPQRRGVGIEYEYPIGQADPQRGVLFFGASVPTGYGWAFPTRAGTIRLGVGVIQPETDLSPRDLMRGLLRSDALKRFGLDQPRDYHVNSGILPSVAFDKQMVFGNVIRVGDSANMATPVLGEGIRHCIEQGRALGEALSSGDLTAWERDAGRKFGLRYKMGFAANQRAAGYGPRDWDRSIARMERLPAHEVTAFLRNDFTAPMIARRAAAELWRRLR